MRLDGEIYGGGAQLFICSSDVAAWISQLETKRIHVGMVLDEVLDSCALRLKVYRLEHKNEFLFFLSILRRMVKMLALVR